MIRDLSDWRVWIAALVIVAAVWLAFVLVLA